MAAREYHFMEAFKLIDNYSSPHSYMRANDKIEFKFPSYAAL